MRNFGFTALSESFLFCLANMAHFNKIHGLGIVGISPLSTPIRPGKFRFNQRHKNKHLAKREVNIKTIINLKHLDVSKNSGTPKSSILIRFSIINHPFWGTPIFGNTHLETQHQLTCGEDASLFLPSDASQKLDGV